MKTELHMEKLIDLALAEDHVGNDITTNSLLEFDNKVIAEVSAKAEGVISGTAVFRATFIKVDPDIKIEIIRQDGSQVKKGDIVIRIYGRESSILKAERCALNFLQRLSGVATLTQKFVQKIRSFNVVLLDTRKTTPGMRHLEKKAVRDGGGRNHRMDLEEMAMVKDNHILMADGITNAVTRIRKQFPGKKIEVEVKNLTELKEAIAVKADIIMLDNFPTDKLKQAVRLNNSRVKLEVSGNVSLENIAEIAATGVDYISSGTLTHSYSSLDLSLNIVRSPYSRTQDTIADTKEP